MKKLLAAALLFLACAGAGNKEFAVWVHPYMTPMVKEKPAPALPEKTLSLRVTPGEYEPAAFAVRADSQEAAVTVSLEGAKGALGLPVAWCELHKVVSLNDSTQPNRLFEFTGPVQVLPGQTQFFWITVHPPAEASPGTYTGKVTVNTASAKEALAVSCEVLPFKLEDSPIVGGVFMASTNLPPGWYQDMKEHGMDAIQFFWSGTGIEIRRQGNGIVMDFTGMDNYMADLVKCGMKGPVVVSLGNDRSMHYERRIAEAMGIRVDTVRINRIRAIGPAMSPRLDQLVLSGLTQLHDHWKQMGWPQEMIILIYDEPTHGLLERGKNRYDLIKKNFPQTRVYGVVMDRRDLAEQVAPQCDVLVANGDFDGVREVAKEHSEGFYVYGSMGNVNYARFRMGCMPWRVDAQGAFFWMYNYWSYPNTCAVYRNPDNPDKLVRSTPWEGVREGVDDLRYFATAERLIERAAAEKKEAARARLDQIKAGIDPEYRGRPPRDQTQDEQSVLGYYNEAQRVRDEVIKIILDVR